MKQSSLFNLDRGELLKERGMNLAANKSEEIAGLLWIARDQAKRIALRRPDRRLTVDAVYGAMEQLGYDPSLLGMAWGSVFREKCWRFTGEYKPSTRVSNHARPVKVWRLVE